MTSESIDIDKAWEDFKETRAFEKAASVQGQLDTMAAILQDIQTNTQRTASVIDQLNGDNAAVDYENQNADPMAMMGVPPGAEEMAPAEGGMPEEEVPEEGREDPNADGIGPEMPPEAEGTAAGDIPPEGDALEGEYPEEGMGDYAGPSDEEVDAILDEAIAGGEGMPEEAMGADTGGTDMVGKIKELIANTDDPSMLTGLSELLTAALAQNAPKPMESFAYSDATDTTTEDVNDGLSEIKKEISDCVDSTLGVDMGSAVAKSDGPDDGIATVEDAKDAEEVTDVKTEDGPDPMTSEGESFKESDDEEDDAEDDEGGSESEPEEEAEIEIEVDPPMDDAIVEEAVGNPVAEEIADKVAAAVEDIVNEVLDGEGEPDDVEDISEDTETFEESSPEMPVMKSFKDMFDERPRFSSVDGSAEIKKASVGSKYEPCTESTQTESEEQADEELRKTAEPTAAPVENESTEATEAFAYSAESSGKHISSFSEMYDHNHTGFAKSISVETSRPGRISMVNGVTDKPSLDPIKKSTIPTFEQMMLERDQKKYQ